MSSKKNHYRLGVIDPLDLWAIRYASIFRNHNKWLSGLTQLKIAKYVNLDDRQYFLEIGPQTGWRTLSSLVYSKQNVLSFDNWSFYPAWKLIKGSIKFVMGNAGNLLPFKDCSFDHCVFMEVMSYLSHPLSMLKEVNRILAPGGYFFISSNNKNSYLYKNKMLDPVMKTFWDEYDMRKAIENTGFEILELYSCGYPLLSLDEKIFYQLQKFLMMDLYTDRKLKKYKGQENLICCVARKL